jgi:LPS export ABC transporter protein LptC
MTGKKLLFPALFSILSITCSLDYSEADLSESFSEDIPDIIIEGYEAVEIRKNSPSLKIEAGKALFYNQKEETHLSDVDFYNYKDNEITSHGRTENAILKMKSGDANMSGGILIESAEDESRLTAESLNWKDQEKTLTSGLDEKVQVIDKDGSTLEGKGFSADIKSKSIIFEGEISGAFISEQ